MLYINPQLQPGYKDLSLAPGSAKREAEALKEFEQLFLFQMLKEMRKSVQDSGLMGDGMKRAYFEEMMDDVVAGEMAASGQLGVARQMAAELHVKEAHIFPPARPDGGLAPSEGLPVHRRTSGIATKGSGAASLFIPDRPAGIAIAPVVATPVLRAHEGYRINQ